MVSHELRILQNHVNWFFEQTFLVSLLGSHLLLESIKSCLIWCLSSIQVDGNSHHGLSSRENPKAQLSWIAVTQVKVEPGDSETEEVAIIHPEKNGWGLCHPWDQFFFTWGKKDYECSDVFLNQKKTLLTEKLRVSYPKNNKAKSFVAILPRSWNLVAESCQNKLRKNTTGFFSRIAQMAAWEVDVVWRELIVYKYKTHLYIYICVFIYI